MANVDAPFGLYPVGHLTNGQYDGRNTKYYVPATDGTALFVGDIVKSTGTGSADGKYATVTAGAAADLIRGVVVGFEVDMTVAASEYPGYRPASTEMYVLVCDDPDVIFEIQEDAVGGAMAVTVIGNTVDVTLAAGSTTTGRSGTEIDSSDAGTGANLKILSLKNSEDSELGASSAGAIWRVMINEHELKAAVAGV